MPTLRGSLFRPHLDPDSINDSLSILKQAPILMPNNTSHDRSIDGGWLLDSPERSLSWSRKADRDPKAAGTLRQYIYMHMAA